MVEVKKRDEEIFDVTVTEGDSASTHRVTLPHSYYQKLTSGRTSPEELIRLSFAFLLGRESKESILSSFELSVIQRYFPEYEKTIRKEMG